MLSGGTCSRMMGSSVLDWAFGIIAANTFPPRFNKPNTGTLPAAPRPRLPLRTPPKVTLIRLHLARQVIAGPLTGNQLAQPMVKHSGSIPVHTDKLRRGSCRGSCDKQINQASLLLPAQPASPSINHSLKLPFSGLFSYASPLFN